MEIAKHNPFLLGFSIINHPLLGVPFVQTPIYIYIYMYVYTPSASINIAIVNGPFMDDLLVPLKNCVYP